MSTTPALSIRELTYGYRHYWTLQRAPCIHGLTLDVRQGESFGFLGHNGAGKTTTIKCILGLLKPQQGTITLFGASSREASSRTLLGYLPEQPYFYKNLTVSETLSLYASLAGITRTDAPAAIEKVLHEVEMYPFRDRPLRKLSKGQIQRVAMAHALVGEPRLLVLDEPFSGLDPMGRKLFADILHRRKAAGCTLFICSHILNDIESLCDRVSIMKQGRLRGVYDIDALPHARQGFILTIERTPPLESLLIPMARSHQRNERFTSLEFESYEQASKACSLTLAHEVRIHTFQSLRLGLEEVFTTLMESPAQEESS